jgi:hypothetical protein
VAVDGGRGESVMSDGPSSDRTTVDYFKISRSRQFVDRKGTIVRVIFVYKSNSSSTDMNERKFYVFH